MYIIIGMTLIIHSW